MDNFKRIRILIFLVFTSLFLVQTRSFNETITDLIDFSNLHRFFSVLILLFLSIKYNLNLSVSKNNNSVLKYYGIYIFTGFLSTIFFSEIIYLSFWKLTEILSIFFAALFINKLCSINFQYFEYVFNLIITYLKFIIVLCLVGVIIFPEIAIQPPSQYQEAFLPYILYGSIIKINPNSIGLIAAIIFINSIVNYLISKNKLKNGIWIIILFLVVVFAQSRTSLLALIIALVFFIVQSKIISNFF